jgi:hypothetical protein
MINFPTREMRPANLPPFARAIRCQDERTFSCADQDSNFIHDLAFSFLIVLMLLLLIKFKESLDISGLLLSTKNRDVSLRST